MNEKRGPAGSAPDRAPPTRSPLPLVAPTTKRNGLTMHGNTVPCLPDVLDSAADRIQANGLWSLDWWPGSGTLVDVAYTDGAACCTVGGIAIALGYRDARDITAHVAHEDAESDEVHPAVAVMLDHLGFDRAAELFNWSDVCASRGRDSVVIDALRACAAELRQTAAVAS